MGWSSGHQVYKPMQEIFERLPLPDKDKVALLVALIKTLQGCDWDEPPMLWQMSDIEAQAWREVDPDMFSDVAD